MSTAVPEERSRRRLPGRLRRPGHLPRPDLTRTALGVVLLLGLAAILAPALVSLLGLSGPDARDGSALNLFSQPTGPSSAHPLGVDAQGRDVLSRMLFGLRSLLWMSVVAVAGAKGAVLLLERGLEVVPTVAGTVLRAGWGLILDALERFPPLLLGLGVGMTVGPGHWRLVLALGVALVPRARRWGPWALLAEAAALDVGLTFLGMAAGAGGTNAPELGAMMTRGGSGILAGVPAWWELVFPGLLAVALLLGLAALGARRPSAPPLPPGRLLLESVASLGLVGGLGWLLLPDLGGHDAVGTLNGAGTALGPTGSLLLGGLVVWAALAALGWRLLAAPRRALPRWLAGLIAPGRGTVAALAIAPPGWLGFVGLYLLADSVGKLAVVPGAGAYRSPSAGLGHWAAALLLPWLLLGAGAAALSVGAMAGRLVRIRDGAQQRVARAAGVGERALARQRRRALLAVLAAEVSARLGTFLGALVLLEVTFRIPGLGSFLVRDVDTGRSAGASAVVVLGAVVVIGADLGLGLVRRRLDPRGELA